MATTTENLLAAFAGESQANRKYLAFAAQAEKDGKPNVARLFRAAAEAETIHAHTHFRNLGGVKGTPENLEAAIAGETYEATTMYPAMVKDAEADGNAAVAKSFDLALRAEARHAKLYRETLDAVRLGRDLESAEVFLCTVCGNLELKQPTTNCEICGATPDKFVRVT
jgi:rubrerythrin